MAVNPTVVINADYSFQLVMRDFLSGTTRVYHLEVENYWQE
jgi:hypothetical protein